MNPASLDALKAYEQADEEGVMVLVSRQALDDAIETIENLYALGLLVEEAGELAQIVGKALRFGMDAPGPNREPYLGRTARQLLPIEGGDMMAALDWAEADGVIDGEALRERAFRKIERLFDPTSLDSKGGRLAPRPRRARP